MSFSENALFIMEKLYYKRTKTGELIERKPEDLFRRITDFVSSAEKTPDQKKKLSNDLFDQMSNQKLMFSSPTLFNAGSDFPLSSSCFVGQLDDDMVAIMKAATDTAITFKMGAGMGLNFGTLRPKGAAVGRGGTSSGPVNFMNLFNQVGETVKSGGVRRAAFMAMMDVNHPDIEEFIASKDFLAQIRRMNPEVNIPDNLVDNLLAEIDGGITEYVPNASVRASVSADIQRNLFEPLSNMNISVAATDEFMQGVKNDSEFQLDRHKSRGVMKTVRAKELFRQIAQSAWRTADPGVWFIDKANEFDTIPSLGRIESTNPCGEQSLHGYTSCNLGSINLVKYISKKGFDTEAFEQSVRLFTRALDDIIDVAAFPTDDFTKNTRLIRPIGLGYTGLAEAMYILKIAYNSEEGFEFAANVTRVMTQTAIRASIELSREKGSFPLFEDNKEALIKTVRTYFDTDEEKAEIEAAIRQHGIRNSNWTTLAPTGSISLILDAFTYSLEPQFALAYNKNLIDGGVLTYVDPEFKKAIGDKAEIIKKVVDNGGSCQGIAEVPQAVQKVYVVAHDIHYKDRIRMQSAIQRYITNSISSTINLPSETSVEEIESIYMMAYEMNLKGITIYRDGCKSFQPMTAGKKKEKAEKPAAVSEPIAAKTWSRPTTLKGEIVKTKTGSGTLYTSLGIDESMNPVEIFINISKHGSETSSFSEALGRVISIALQNGVPAGRLADSIIGIVGDKPTWDNGKLIKSIPDAIGRVLKTYADRSEANDTEESLFVKKSGEVNQPEIDYTNPTEIPGAEICPNCGEKALVRTEDCQSCLSCGFSKCG